MPPIMNCRVSAGIDGGQLGELREDVGWADVHLLMMARILLIGLDVLKIEAFERTNRAINSVVCEVLAISLFTLTNTSPYQ